MNNEELVDTVEVVIDELQSQGVCGSEYKES